MKAYNAYIEQLPRGRDAFSAELQGLEFLSEAAGTGAKLRSNFANEVKNRGNWKQAGYPEENLYSLSTPLHTANALRQATQVAQEVAFKTIAETWG